MEINVRTEEEGANVEMDVDDVVEGLLNAVESSSISQFTHCQSESDDKLCAVCFAPNSKSCTNCKKANYCSKDHQIDHWKVHKEQCFPVVLDPGKGFVTTRDIKQLEVFFKEPTLLCAPGPWDRDAMEVSNGRPICISCCQIIQTWNEDESNHCMSCKWPVCSLFCQTDKRHSENECKILTQVGLSSLVLNQMPNHEWILVLRTLCLRNSDPVKWNYIIQYKVPLVKALDNFEIAEYIDKTVRFVRQRCKLTEFNDKTIQHVAVFCLCHTFWNDDHPSITGCVYRICSYLCREAGNVQHSCTPNSEWTVLSSPLEEICFRASVPIKAGDTVTISINPKHLLYSGTHGRQKFLNNSKTFGCKCDRCSDPTELNNFISALKCSKQDCRDGYLLPENPLCEDSSWKCNTCFCTMSSDRVIRFLNGLQSLIDPWVIVNDPIRGPKSSSVLKNTVIQIKRQQRVIHKLKHKLHSNHYMILQVEWGIIQNSYFYLINLTGWGGTLHLTLMELGRKHLKLFDSIAAGLPRRRGFLAYYVQQGLVHYLRQGDGARKSIGMKHDGDCKSYTRSHQELVKLRGEILSICSFRGQLKNSMEEEMVNFTKANLYFPSEFVMIKFRECSICK